MSHQRHTRSHVLSREVRVLASTFQVPAFDRSIPQVIKYAATVRGLQPHIRIRGRERVRPFWFPLRIVLICCVVRNSDGVLCAEGLLLLAASITSQTAWRIPVMSTYTTLGTLQIPTLRCRYVLCLVFYPILFMLYIMFSGTLNWSNICYNIYIIYFI